MPFHTGDTNQSLRLIRFLLVIVAIVSTAVPAKSDDLPTGQFDVPVAELSGSLGTIYSAGAPLNSTHPKIHLLRTRRLAEAAQKFPDAISCLNTGSQSAVANLTRLAEQKIDTPSDFSVCIQRIAKFIDSPTDLSRWFVEIGFETVLLQENGPAAWAALNQPNKTGGHSLAASWRRRASMLGKPYPLSLKFSLGGNDLAGNFSVSVVLDASGDIFDVKSSLTIL